jgi:hypothetical protein
MEALFYISVNEKPNESLIEKGRTFICSAIFLLCKMVVAGSVNATKIFI